MKQKLNAIEKVECEDCCLNREHACVIELFHILQHFDDAFSLRLSAKKFRLKLLKDLLFECTGDTNIVEISINSYESLRPWIRADKENFIPS